MSVDVSPPLGMAQTPGVEGAGDCGASQRVWADVPGDARSTPWLTIRVVELTHGQAAVVVAGVIVVLLGLLSTMQGIDVIRGGSMSGTTTWMVIGPVVLLIGRVIVAVGIRGRQP